MIKKANTYIYCGLFLNASWLLVLMYIMVGPFVFSGMPVLKGEWIGFCSFSIIALNTVFFHRILKSISKSNQK